MIAIRVAVYPSLLNIQDPQVRVARTLEIMEHFFNLAFPFIVTILITSIMLINALELEGATLQLKEAIWTIMFLNFMVMKIRRNRAQIQYIEGKTEIAGNILKPIGKYMIPLNIILGVIAIYLGIGLRGF
jgi:uncharacterized membrane protein